MNALLDAALAYAEMGFPVFPCVPDGKAPLTPHGFKDATTLAEKIIKWWTRWPLANVAIHTAGMCVIDIDGSDNDWPGEDRAGDLLEAGAVALTPRGGRHYWFREPEGVQLDSTAGKVARAVDTRSNGGYVLVYPSTVNGKGYSWIDGMELGKSLPVVPAWIVDALQAVPERRQASTEPGEIGDNWWSEIERDYAQRTDWSEILEPHGWTYAGPSSVGLDGWTRPGKEKGISATTGMRNTGHDLLVVFSSNAEPFEAKRSYGKFRAFAILEHGGLLVKAAEQLRSQGYGHIAEEVAVDLSGLLGSLSGQAEPREPRPVVPVDPGEFPAGLMQVPGFIGEVVEYMLATAKRQQPVLSLAASICLQATLIGRKVQDRTGTRPNLYTIGLAPSGSGKDWPRQVCKRILAESGQVDLIGPEALASAQALAREVSDSPSCLALFDEFGKTLGIISNATKSPFLAAIPSLLLKLYSSSGSVWRADSRADRENNIEVNQPHLVVFGTSVAEGLLTALTVESITDGLLGRFLVFEGLQKRPKLRRATSLPLPACVLNAAVAWRDLDVGNLGAENPDPMVIQATDEAEDLLDQFSEACDTEAERIGYPFGDLWARGAEKACKLALIYACSVAMDRPESAVIDANAVRWGCSLVEYLTRRLAFLANDWIADGKFDAHRLKVLRAIRQAGEKGITGNELCRKTQALQPDERARVIDALIEAEEIVVDLPDGRKRGRPRKVYRIAAN